MPDPEGRVIDAASFAANHDRWLPNADDELYITGLMKPVDAAGAYAGWIAAPKAPASTTSPDISSM